MWQHVVPLNDLIEHNTDTPECACNPKFDFEDKIIFHFAMDRRETYEQENDITYHGE